MPVGYEQPMSTYSYGAKVRILSVDNQAVYTTGLIHQGEQRCDVEILNGKHQGDVVLGVNYLIGKLELR